MRAEKWAQLHCLRRVTYAFTNWSLEEARSLKSYQMIHSVGVAPWNSFMHPRLISTHLLHPSGSGASCAR